jgi:hypothetical protein
MPIELQWGEGEEVESHQPVKIEVEQHRTLKMEVSGNQFQFPLNGNGSDRPQLNSSQDKSLNSSLTENLSHADMDLLRRARFEL